MCLPFCCGGDDPPKTSPAHHVEPRPGKGANNDPGVPAPAMAPPSPGKSEKGASPDAKSTHDEGKTKVPTTPPRNDPGHGGTGATTQPEQAPRGNQHADVDRQRYGPVADPMVASQPKQEATEEMRAPQMPPMARRGQEDSNPAADAAASPRHRAVPASQPKEATERTRGGSPIPPTMPRRSEGNYNPTAPASVPAPGASNVAHGGRGHDGHPSREDDDDGKPRGKSW
ncbi:hypothetical protein ACP4OV_001392 [Aristida adscensionis]